GWGRPRADSAVAVAARWAGPELTQISLRHGVDRIEAMGSGAVIIGGDGRDLHFSGVRLGADSARFAHRYTQPAASQGETRSHGFFYRPDAADAGVLGLPVRGGDRPGYEHLRVGSASILFLRNQDFRLTELGALAAGDPTGDDGCRASCVDWYGNARPLFLRGRVFALMGYDLVEGREADGRIRELRRVTFAPRPLTADLAGNWAFTETIGERGSAYFCANAGTMNFRPEGSRLHMSYRQTTDCVMGGDSAHAESGGTGTGTIGFGSISLAVDNCEYNGELTTADEVAGTVWCRITRPDGTAFGTYGRWQARRVSSAQPNAGS
ncbi:MAG TPA: hypothetical protein VLK84_20245, partial [Longimicrobium sp.]|nr:hypothetical protein [Longimicrobium sp.]